MTLNVFGIVRGLIEEALPSVLWIDSNTEPAESYFNLEGLLVEREALSGMTFEDSTLFEIAYYNKAETGGAVNFLNISDALRQLFERNFLEDEAGQRYEIKTIESELKDGKLIFRITILEQFDRSLQMYPKMDHIKISEV